MYFYCEGRERGVKVSKHSHEICECVCVYVYDICFFGAEKRTEGEREKRLRETVRREEGKE